MPVTTLTQMPARHWRLLNWLFDCVMARQPCRVATAINEQGATTDDLIRLEQHGLIRVLLGATTISYAEQFGGAAPASAMLHTTMRLTRFGTDLVHDNRYNRVVRSLYWLEACRQIWYVEQEAGVDDAILKEMDDVGLIESVDPRVPLTGFRKLPGELKIRLTLKGRRYAARGAPSST
jgi:hypothetical protein